MKAERKMGKSRQDLQKRNKLPKELIKAIRENKSFLISSHINPEGDAIGSQIALRELLLRLGKRVRIVNSDKVPVCYHFIPRWKSIVNSPKDFFYQVVFILDCSDLSRIGKVKDKINKDKLVVNIDHHESNANFADINWVDRKASCVCEMIYNLYKSLAIKINKKAALALYAGLVTDTGSFCYPNTSPQTLAIASHLLRYKFNVYDIYRNVFGCIPITDMKLIIEALSALKYNRKKRVAWLRLSRGILKRKSVEFDMADTLLSLIRLIKEVDVVVLFKEAVDRPDTIRVNFRSTGRLNVSRLASLFGGGGHKTASGCTLKGDAEIIEKRILAALFKAIKTF